MYGCSFVQGKHMDRAGGGGEYSAIPGSDTGIVLLSCENVNHSVSHRVTLVVLRCLTVLDWHQ